MKLPRIWHGVLASLLALQPCSELLAQAVSFAPSTHRITSPSRNTTASTSVENTTTSVSPNISIFDDEIVLSQLNHISLFGAAAVTATAASIPNLTYQASSLAATEPNVNPFYATSINPLASSAHYIYPVAPSANSSNLVASGTNIVSSSHLGQSRIPSPSRALSTLSPSISSSSAQILGVGALVSSGAIRTSVPAGFSISTLVGVPEPSTLVLTAAIFLMIGYGWLRGRWQKEEEIVEEEQLAEESVDLGKDIPQSVSHP